MLPWPLGVNFGNSRGFTKTQVGLSSDCSITFGLNKNGERQQHQLHTFLTICHFRTFLSTGDKIQKKLAEDRSDK